MCKTRCVRGLVAWAASGGGEGAAGGEYTCCAHRYTGAPPDNALPHMCPCRPARPAAERATWAPAPPTAATQWCHCTLLAAPLPCSSGGWRTERRRSATHLPQRCHPVSVGSCIQSGCVYCLSDVSTLFTMVVVRIHQVAAKPPALCEHRCDDSLPTPWGPWASRLPLQRLSGPRPIDAFRSMLPVLRQWRRPLPLPAS